jgi:hypothetical protein
MALHVTGLGVDDYAEIVESLLIAADHAQEETAALRRDIADRIGQALDSLPPPRIAVEAREEVEVQ